jgi:hypothetical protein
MALATGAALAPTCSGLASLLGQQLFPANYPWNQNIANAPVATNSAAVISHIGSSVHIHPDWGEDNPTNGASPLYGIPYNVVHGNSTTKISVIIDNYPGESDIVPMPIPTNAVIEGDFQNGPNTNGPGYNPNQRGDSHLIVWDEDNNIGYELYGACRPSDTNTLDETPHTDGKWHAAQESVWQFNTDQFRTLGATSADAAGLSILAGLARPDEGLTVAQGGQGAINHAIRFTLLRGEINPQYIYPGSHIVSGTVSSANLPFGARLRLRNSTAVNTKISSMPPQSQIVAHAMQQYGLVLADVGSSMYVTGASGSVNATNGLTLVWDNNDINGSTGLKVLTASDFDLVMLTPIITGLSPTNGPAGSTITVLGQNFSGAAGALSVFFGTHVAPSVNVLDDGHISVTVPSGLGTVDVTVQSGTNEVDTVSGSPNANVTAPIFGYGISAVTNADRFVFTGALPAMPSIKNIALSGTNILLKGTNNSGPGGTYHVLISSNLALPRTNWSVLSSGSFDNNGNFSFTNALGTNAQRFYILQVP